MKPEKAAFICSTILAVGFAWMPAGSLFAQSGDPPKPASAVTKTVEKASPGTGAVIGHLQSRDKVVTISKGKKGTVYTVKDKDGKMLNADLSEKDFQSKYPALYDQVKHGLAGNDASLRKPAQ
jgi:hypothetical protein